MRDRILGAALALASAHSLAAVPNNVLGAIDPEFDYHSYANTDQFRVTHLELNLRIYMSQKAMDGVVGLQLKRLDPDATQVVLDTKGLMIQDVSEKTNDIIGATSKTEATWVSRPFHVEKPDPILGSALIIDLPRSKKSTLVLKIQYETTEASSALQWLDAHQTAGQKKPFLYTQSEAIGARSWIPLQDTPSVRAPYEATVYTDEDQRAVMSAKSDPKEHRGEYHFVMDQPVPSYLIALAVGDLRFQATGPRTGVWAEKSVLKEAVKEFADTEAMIQANEKMFGPYRWERYDILVMPPSFPVGGMENPRLSFITPTILAGDKSLVSVIAHELAHSWAGNLVGNATWRDLWLNEGFTDYMQSRIITAVYGAERANMEEVLDLNSLREDLKTLPPKDQVLAVDLRNRNPDEVFSEVPYEKGRLFLKFLDAKFGREHFDAFLRGYFDHFAFKALTTSQFVKYLKENLLDKYPDTVSAAEVDQWVNGPGLPAYAVLPSTQMFAVVDQTRTDWLAGKAAAGKFGKDWVTQQWIYFLDNLPATLASAQMATLDQAYGLTKSTNAEIEESWLKVVIAHDYGPGKARLESYLINVGRLKLVLPLYQQLAKTEAGRVLAKRVYKQARPNYHAYTVSAIDALMEPDSDSD
ncbi:MAG TPA: M1 family metallopeptidase [Steroidobacteraceae bacterium]|jgi:aminopeptidase N